MNTESMGTFFGNKKGLGLVEVLMAGGAAAIIAVATTQVTTNMFKAQKSVAQTQDVNTLFSELNLLLNDSANCIATFNGVVLGPTTRNTPFQTTSGDTYQTNGTQNFLNGTVRITGWRLEQTRVLTSAPAHTVEAQLSVDFERNQMANRAAIGGAKITRSLVLTATLTGPGGAVTSACSSVNTVSAPTYWNQLGNDIFNSNSGNVGIGAVTPPIPLKLTVWQAGAGPIIVARDPVNSFQIALGTTADAGYVESTNANLVLSANGASGLTVDGAGVVTVTNQLLTPYFAIRSDNAPQNDRPYTRGAADHFVLAPAANITGGADPSTIYLAYPSELSPGNTVTTRIQETVFIQPTTNAGNGNVGIGAPAIPGNKLYVAAGGNVGLRIDSNTDDIHMITNKDHVIRFDTAAQNNDGLSFWNDAGLGTIFKIASNGRIGINRPVPTQALDVGGNINATGSISAAGNMSGSSFCIGGNCRTTFAAQSCPAGSAATTINADGSVTCTDVGISMNQRGLACPGGTYLAATDGAGNPVCRAVPTPTCPFGQYVVSYNSATDTVSCAPVPPEVQVGSCPAGQYLTAISAGVGVCSFPIANTTCPAGQMIVGITNGSPVCGNEAQLNGACGPSQKVTGFTASGAVICAEETQNGASCGVGQTVTGFTPTGTPTCSNLPTLSTSCGVGQKITGFNSAGAAICANEVQMNQSCPAGQKITGFDASGNRICANEVQNGQVCGSGYVASFNSSGLPVCITPSAGSLQPYTMSSVSISSGGGGNLYTSSVTCPGGSFVRACGVRSPATSGEEDNLTCRLNVAANSCIGYRNQENSADGSVFLDCFCEGP